MRRIAVLTGKRGGFGALIPLFQLAQKDPDLDLGVIATDMHLSETFGHTLDEVQRWVRNVVPVPIAQGGGSPVSRTDALGRALSGVALALEKLKPDLFLVLGDRGETLAAVTAALHLRIPVAHIQGGDVSGNIDEAMRHAITKLSHLHFPSNEESAIRIRKMGEEDWRIHVVGDPHVDRIMSKEFTSGPDVRDKYEIGKDARFVLVLYHPETLNDHASSGPAMRALLDEVAALHLRALVVYPCSDPGYEEIIKVIDGRSGQNGLSVHRNIEAVDFWGLQAEASLLAGNSSAGLIEAPYFGLPVVNVGHRQEGRMRWINVIDVPAEASAIRNGLRKALSEEFRHSLQVEHPPPFRRWKRLRRDAQGLEVRGSG